MSVNHRVKEIRTFLGMSQSAFAENLHLSGGYISSLEKENREVNRRIIKLICATYGVNEVWLKTGTSQMFDLALDTKAERVITFFKEMSPENQELFLRLIDTILKLQNNMGADNREITTR